MQRSSLTGEARESLLRRLMDTYGTSVLRVCFLYLHDHGLAQDAAQTTFLKAWQALDTLREGPTEKAWLMAIAVNTCKSGLRKTKRSGRIVSLDNAPEPAVNDTYQDDTVLEAVMSLAPKYCEVIMLHYYQSLSTPEVARILHIPQSTVLTRLHRARNLLQPMLKGWYLNDE